MKDTKGLILIGAVLLMAFLMGSDATPSPTPGPGPGPAPSPVIPTPTPAPTPAPGPAPNLIESITSILAKIEQLTRLVDLFRGENDELKRQIASLEAEVQTLREQQVDVATVSTQAVSVCPCGCGLEGCTCGRQSQGAAPAKASSTSPGYRVTLRSDGRYWWHDGAQWRYWHQPPVEGMVYGGRFVYRHGLMREAAREAGDRVATQGVGTQAVRRTVRRVVGYECVNGVCQPVYE